MAQESGRAFGLAGWARSGGVTWPKRARIIAIAEAVLVALIAIQLARLAWIALAPPAPIGDYAIWPAPRITAGAPAGDFDPFFRLAAPPGPAVVTSLNLKLHGVREDRATGRGSAIIALPDGTQRSFATGEEIIPGVRLVQVSFDGVTIDRSGVREQLFLDQSESPAPAAPIARAVPSATPAVPRTTPTGAEPAAEIPLRFQPRTNGTQVDGLLVSEGNDGGQAFRAAGFAPGDVIVAIDRQPITSLDQARTAVEAGAAEITVDRAGRRVTLRAGARR